MSWVGIGMSPSTPLPFSWQGKRILTECGAYSTNEGFGGEAATLVVATSLAGPSSAFGLAAVATWGSLLKPGHREVFLPESALLGRVVVIGGPRWRRLRVRLFFQGAIHCFQHLDLPNRT